MGGWVPPPPLATILVTVCTSTYDLSCLNGTANLRVIAHQSQVSSNGSCVSDFYYWTKPTGRYLLHLAASRLSRSSAMLSLMPLPRGSEIIGLFPWNEKDLFWWKRQKHRNVFGIFRKAAVGTTHGTAPAESLCDQTILLLLTNTRYTNFLSEGCCFELHSKLEATCQQKTLSTALLHFLFRRVVSHLGFFPCF